MFTKQWDLLRNRFEAGHLAHAYLFAGKDNERIESFAKKFIQLINCASLKKPCEACQFCGMIEKETFPDAIFTKSSQSPSSQKNERDMMEISIEQIRQAQNFLAYKPYYGGYKALLVYRAERMSPQAQHSFLKTLEEPKGKTLIILLSAKPEFLLPTIKSRCQEIKFLGTQKQPPENKEILQIINGNLAEKFRYAKAVNLEGENFNDILNNLQRHFRNLLLGKLGIGKESENLYSLEKLQHILKIIDTLSYQAVTSNINQKLALEILLLEV